MSIIGVLLAIGLPTYAGYIKQNERAVAISDIHKISMALERYHSFHSVYPEDLSDAVGSKLDPWGNPYQFLNLATVQGNGKVRKDKNLVPINSDYDLYSMGEDGKSVSPLTAKHSRDDIVRAGNGQFVGLAEEF